MDGSSELRQLAHLLRTGAEATREIAGFRPRDAVDLMRLVEEAKSIADRLEAIAAFRPIDDVGGRH